MATVNVAPEPPASVMTYEAGGVRYTQLLQAHIRAIDIRGLPVFNAAAVETVVDKSSRELVEILLRGRAKYACDPTSASVVEQYLHENKPVFLVDAPHSPFLRKHFVLGSVWDRSPVYTFPYVALGASIEAIGAQDNPLVLLGYVAGGFVAFVVPTLTVHMPLLRAAINGKISPRLARVSGLLTSITSPVLGTLRNALAAEKIEAIAEKLKETIDEPSILLSFGAAHYGIRGFLQNLRSRRTALKLLESLSFGVLDKDSFDTVGEIATRPSFVDLNAELTYRGAQSELLGAMFKLRR